MDNSTSRGVIFLITNEENRFLLEQRDGNSKLSKWSWVFPGGGRDEGEEPLQTVLREVKEEFGINLNPKECKKIGTAITHSGKGINEIWHCPLKDTPKPLVISESAGAGWFTFKEIKKMDLGYNQVKLIMSILLDKF